jgi:CTP synthase (UTP-ammonia lyase)
MMAKNYPMKTNIRIGLIGDFNAEVTAHVAIPKALEFAGQTAECNIAPLWIHTSSIIDSIDSRLAGFDGLWCVPASPYASMDGALKAIRFARETDRPFLGTCGGFQHAILEFARNVLGQIEADHAESNPAATMPLISPLSCSLVGASGRIFFKTGSRAARIYGCAETVEEYHCNYGVNPRFRSLLDDSGMKITGVDEDNDARVVELEGHPFFMGTLFQPERSAFKGVAHPLIVEFVRAAASVPTA